MGLLELKNITLELGGKRILNELSLDIWEGHVHALVGQNGAGKSTTANTIMGLPDYRNITGDIVFNGERITDLGVHERARRGITLAWQEPARFEGLLISRFITAGAKNKDLEHARELLDMVGLEPGRYMNRAVDKTLSGGERKRVELASILAMEPRLVMMDEPDSGINVSALEMIFDAMKVLKEKGATILLITHSPTVLKQADHAFLLCCGRLIDKGPVDKIEEYFRGKCLPCDHINQPDEQEVL